MPNNDTIQSFINVPQVQSEIDVVTNGLQSIKDLILTMPQVVSSYKSNNSLVESKQATDDLTSATNKLNASQKDLNIEIERSRILSKQKYEDERAGLESLIATRIKLQNAISSYNVDEKENLALMQQGKITRAEYNQRMIETTATVERHKTRIQDLNARIKENTAESVIAKSAYKSLTDQYNAAAIAAKNYSIELGANHPQTLAAVENAKKLNTQLKEVDASVGQNQKSVGNYEGAMAKAFGRVTSLSNIGARAITMLSRQIIGVGVGMLSFVIGAKAIEMISNKLVEVWDKMHSALNHYKQKLDDLREVREDANKKSGEEITSLNILYKAATNVANSTDLRTEAITKLQAIYPKHFDNITAEEFLNGKAKKSYDELTTSILKTSRARATQDKMEDLQRQVLDVNDKESEIIDKAEKAKKEVTMDDSFYNKKGSLKRHQNHSLESKRNVIASQEANDLFEQQEEKRKLQDRLENLAKSVGDQTLVDGITPPKPKKPKKIHEDSESLANEYRKKDLETLALASKEELNILKDKYKVEFEDQKLSLDKRYEALAFYNQASLKLINREKQDSLDQLKLEVDTADKKAGKIKDAGKREEALFAIHKYYIDKQATINKTALLADEKLQTEIFNDKKRIVKEYFDYLQVQAERSFKNKTDVVDISKDQKLESLNQAFLKGKIKSEEVFAYAKKKIEDESAIEQIKLEIDTDKKILDIKTKAMMVDFDLSRKIHDNEVKLSTLLVNKKTADEKKAADAKIRIAEEAYAVITTLASGSFTKSINQIQDQIDANTKLKDQELERVNSSTLSEQDKAAKIAQINAHAQAKQDQLEKHKRDLQLQQAKFDRDAAVLSIIAHAAAANQTFKDQAGIFGIPIALQNDIEAALQVAMIMARPLPKFESGTSSSPEGFALTDEKGPEGYITPSGKTFIGNNQPTLRYLERGTKIIPHNEINDMMMRSLMRNTAASIPKDNSAAEIREAIVWASEQTIREMKKQKTKNVTNVKIDTSWADYIYRNVKN